MNFRDVESIKYTERLYGILEDYLGACFLMITLVMTLNHYRYIDAIISQDCLINTAEALFMLLDAVQADFWLAGNLSKLLRIQDLEEIWVEISNIKIKK